MTSGKSKSAATQRSAYAVRQLPKSEYGEGRLEIASSCVCAIGGAIA